MASTGVVPALQAALAAENAAIFGYGVAGAHLTGSSQAAAEQDWTAHNQAGDTLAAVLSARRSGPRPGAAPPWPSPVLPRQARSLHDRSSTAGVAHRSIPVGGSLGFSQS